METPKGVGLYISSNVFEIQFIEKRKVRFSENGLSYAWDHLISVAPFLFVGARFARLQMKAQLALEILVEVKENSEELGEIEKKVFKPKYDAERLSDYGEKPDESF